MKFYSVSIISSLMISFLTPVASYAYKPGPTDHVTFIPPGSYFTIKKDLTIAPLSNQIVFQKGSIVSNYTNGARCTLTSSLPPSYHPKVIQAKGRHLQCNHSSCLSIGSVTAVSTNYNFPIIDSPNFNSLNCYNDGFTLTIQQLKDTVKDYLTLHMPELDVEYLTETKQVLDASEETPSKP